MADRTTADLGTGWLVAPAPQGGLNLQVSPRGRGCVIVGAASLALGWIGRSLYAVAVGQPLPLGASPPVTLGISLVLTGLALWCAFGTEGWHVARNCLEHQVGIGRWRHVRRYRDAALEIIGRRNKYGKVYYRLYAVIGSERHFLLERRLPELSAWADFVATQTGWPRHDAA